MAIGAAAGVTHAVRSHLRARETPGGLLMPNVGAYDVLSRILLGSIYRTIADDVAAIAPPSAAVLEVGCGPGQLSVSLARDHDLDVTGVDLDPEMIARARANADRNPSPDDHEPRFAVGDAAALPFSDGSFDVVVSTFSMHHWSDPRAGLIEIARVLRPGGRALIWDFRTGLRLFHAHVPDPAAQVHATPLELLSVRPWRWPWRLTLAQRLELVRPTSRVPSSSSGQAT